MRQRTGWLMGAVAGGLLTPAAGQEILVSGFNSNEVHRYDFATGVYLGPLAQVNQPQAVAHGPDGLLYIAVEGDCKVVRVDPATAPLTEDFVYDDPATPGNETGGLASPTGAVFGPDGDLYVASFATDRVLRYDGTTGTFKGVFVKAGDGGLNGPDSGMAFGPDGHLYVPSFFNNRVLRYDGQSGAFLDAFIPPTASSLVNPRTVVFRSDGEVFISGEGNNRLMHFTRDGVYVGDVAVYNRISGMQLAPQDGNFYATSTSRNNVLRFDGTTGANLGAAVGMGSGGLDAAVFLTFYPDPFLRMGRLQPGAAGVVNQLAIRGGTPSTSQVLLVGTAPDSLPLRSCSNLWLGVLHPQLFFLTSDGTGAVDLSSFIGTAQAGATVVIQTIELSSCRVSNQVIQTL